MKTTKRLNNTVYGFYFLVAVNASPMAVQAKNLEDVITSLYGGDGVQLITSKAGFSHAPHFQDDALHELNQLTQGTLEAHLPTPSTSSGMIYQYDAILNDFIPSHDSLGPVFVERASTLGSGKIMFGLSYSSANWDRYNNSDLHNIVLTLDHEDLQEPGSDICIGGPAEACYLFEEDDIELTVDINFRSKGLFLFSSYGLTNNWDIGVIVPILQNKLSVSAKGKVIEHESSQFFPHSIHKFDEAGLNGDAPTDVAKGSETGIGDIQLFSKHNLISAQDHQLSLAFNARLATGDKANLMGYDNYGFKAAILSSHHLYLGETPLKLHANFGYEINADIHGQNKINFAFALEQPIKWHDSELMISYEVLAKKETNQKKDAIVDAAISVKWLKNNVGAFSFSGRVPLKSSGLESDLIYGVGYEIYF